MIVFAVPVPGDENPKTEISLAIISVLSSIFASFLDAVTSQSVIPNGTR